MARHVRTSLGGAWALALAGSVAALTACEQRRNDPPGIASASEPSPNASVLPTPLVAGPTKATARDAGHPQAEAPSDAGVPEPPRPLREDDALSAEAELRAAPGLLLEARLRWLDAPPPRSPEGNAEVLNKARDRNAFDVTIELSSLGRLRLRLSSKAFPFPTGTEIRARDDRYGHLLVWPNAEAYTPLPPGTLRATLAEHRVDVIPLSDPSVVLAGSDNALGLATQKQRLETSVGRLELEQTVAPAAGGAGALLCRLLVELLAVAPESSACRPEWVPLRANYTWASGERFELEATKLTKRLELAVDGLSVPPTGSSSRQGELPGPPFVALIDERELTDFHARALPPPAKPEPGAPKLGLVFQNHGDSPLYLLVEGVPVVWLRADAEWLVSGLKPGRYTVQARDFFGTEASPPRLLELPARFTVGDEAERPAR
ncbi:MAG: hypothetical protein ABUL60_33915 [Myxococcales bacterium]